MDFAVIHEIQDTDGWRQALAADDGSLPETLRIWSSSRLLMRVERYVSGRRPARVLYKACSTRPLARPWSITSSPSTFIGCPRPKKCSSVGQLQCGEVM